MIVLIKRALHVEGSPATSEKISASASGVLLGGRASGMSGILGRGGRVGVGGQEEGLEQIRGAGADWIEGTGLIKLGSPHEGDRYKHRYCHKMC